MFGRGQSLFAKPTAINTRTNAFSSKHQTYQAQPTFLDDLSPKFLEDSNRPSRRQSFSTSQNERVSQTVSRPQSSLKSLLQPDKTRPNTLKERVKNSKSKISYAYKGRFQSLHAELKSKGKFKRDDSWHRFVMADKINRNNHLQKALHKTHLKDVLDNGSRDMHLRNNLEKMTYLLAEEKVENVTLDRTQGRLVEENKKF